MAEKMQIEYEVSVTGLGEAAITAENASTGAKQASMALDGARSNVSRTLPIMLMSVRTLNATRLAVEQTSKAVTDLNPTAAMYAFLNMMQVVRNLTSLIRMLKDSTGAASAAQAILATLTGRWWLIPLAIAAGALVYSKIRSMQTGGPIPETGVYLLHRGEHIIPRETVELTKNIETTTIHSTHRSLHSAYVRHFHRYGPIFITFEKQPAEGPDIDEWLGSLGPKIIEQARRGG